MAIRLVGRNCTSIQSSAKPICRLIIQCDPHYPKSIIWRYWMHRMRVAPIDVEIIARKNESFRSARKLRMLPFSACRSYATHSAGKRMHRCQPIDSISFTFVRCILLCNACVMYHILHLPWQWCRSLCLPRSSLLRAKHFGRATTKKHSDNK